MKHHFTKINFNSNFRFFIVSNDDDHDCVFKLTWTDNLDIIVTARVNPTHPTALTTGCLCWTSGDLGIFMSWVIAIHNIKKSHTFMDTDNIWVLQSRHNLDLSSNSVQIMPVLYLWLLDVFNSNLKEQRTTH